MKKSYVIVLLLLIIPININAKIVSSYDESSGYISKYTKSLNDSDLYFIGDGEFLSKNDYTISKEKNSYLYDGQDYWISDSTSLNQESEAGTRVVETISSVNEVTGEGTYVNPWKLTKVSREAIVSFIATSDTTLDISNKRVSYGDDYGELAKASRMGY